MAVAFRALLRNVRRCKSEALRFNRSVQPWREEVTICQSYGSSLHVTRYASTGVSLINSNVKLYEESCATSPYLEYVVGLEPEGSTPATSTGGSTLEGVQDENRPHPGYGARLITLRIEHGASEKAREAILDEKSYMKDFGRFWIPMVQDLLCGKHHKHALEVFEWMVNHPSVLKSARRLELERLYSMMISYAGVVGKVKKARIWFDNMDVRGMGKSSQCCNALIIAYAKNCDVDSAIAIFNGMKQYCRDCPPNAMTLYILISMYARFNNQMKMEEMLRTCMDSGFSPDLICYNTLLNAYGRMGMLNRLDDVYQEMRTRGLPNKDTYNALLVGYARLDAIDKMKVTLGEMMESGNYEIDERAAEFMAKAYSRNGAVNDLEELMEKIGSKSEIESIEMCVLEAYGKQGNLDKIEKMIEKRKMKENAKEKKKMDSSAMEAVIRAFGKAGEYGRLYALYKEIKEWGLSTATYDALVCEFAKGDDGYERMEEIAADMDTKLSSKTARVMYDAYAKNGAIEKMEKMRLQFPEFEQAATAVA